MKVVRASALFSFTAAVMTASLRAEAGADPLADARALATAHQGLRIMRISGTSMEPFFTDGAVVVVQLLSSHDAVPLVHSSPTHGASTTQVPGTQAPDWQT